MSGLFRKDVLDANESIFFERELEHVIAKSRDRKYRALKFASGALIPINSEADPSDKTLTWRSFSQVGTAEFIRHYANDLPRSDVEGKEETTQIKPIGTSFGYNIDEIQAAAKNNRPLTTMKSDAAKRAIDQKLNKVAFSGRSDLNIPGFFTNPNINDIAIPNDGTGSQTEWDTKTPDQIIRDMNLMTTTVQDITNGVESPDTLLLPVRQFNFIAATPRSSTSDTTILQYFLNNNQHITNVEWLDNLKLADGADDFMMVYVRDPLNLEFHVPLAFNPLPPQATNLAFKVPVFATVGGVTIYYPLSVAKAGGI